MNCYVRPWCANRDRDVCPCDNCASFEPEALYGYEHFFLPAFREWRKLSSSEREAVLYLAAYYQQQGGMTP